MTIASADIDCAGALMLALLAPARGPTAAEFAAMDQHDWQRLITLSQEQRMAPMLYHRDTEAGREWPLPDAVRESWKAGYRLWTLRSLEFERTLHDIAAVMAAAEVPFIALKGSWLAWHAYPHPALRPMRDIDIWVPQDRALVAHAALISGGGRAVTSGYGSADALVGHAKTLPPIWSAKGDILIELHLHLSHHHSLTDDEAERNHTPEDLLPDRVVGQLRGYPVGYLSPTDTLLHLIVHSAYDHGFNNGPAIFDDVAFILAGHVIDWNRFWSRASRQGWTQGAVLVLAMTVRRIGPQPIDWQDNDPEAVPEDVLAIVPSLTLQPENDRATIQFLAGLTGERATRSHFRVLQKLAVPQARLAMFFGVSAKSPLAWLAYPLWLGSGVWRIARGRFNQEVHLTSQRRARLAIWLDSVTRPRRR